MADSEDKDSIARSQLPYKAEYCKTSRASCKKCQQSMMAGSLKLANMTKSRFHDGFDATFYHVSCFFQIKRPNSVAEIRNFETLKYDDQKILEKAIETKGLSIVGDRVEGGGPSKGKDTSNGSKKSAKKKSDKREKEDTDDCLLVNYNDFLMEYAKSNRSQCKACEKKIEKDTVRLGKLDYEADNQWRGGPVPKWYHVDCFANSLQKLEFFGMVNKIKGFSDLEKDDQRMLESKIKPIDKSDVEKLIKKHKTEEHSSEAQEEEERLLKKQSDRFFKLRDIVNTFKKKDLELLLTHLDQRSTFKSPSELVDAATDVLMFGPLERCPICKRTGGMTLRSGGYICTKENSNSEPCTYESREPKRGMPDIPEELIEKYDFFTEKYKFRGGKRIFPSKFIKAVEQKQAEDNKLIQEGAPLEGLSIGIISWKGVDEDKVNIQKKVTSLGGKIKTALDSSLFVILTSKEQLSKDDPKVMVAKELNVPLVSHEFLYNINSKDEVSSEVSKCLLKEWDGDLKDRFDKMIKVAVKDESSP